MAKKSQLIEFYEQVLATGNLEADDDGFINGYSLGKGEPVPMTMGIKRNRLALPLPNVLRNTQDIAIFHPLQENVLEGLTPVMKKLIATYEVIFNMKIMAMITALAKFGTDIELQNKLTGREGIKNLLAKLVRLSIRKHATPVSDTNYENIVSKLEQITKENLCSFITLNVRRAGTADGKKWARAGVVQFPFYNTLIEEEAKEEKSSLGTKKEIRILIAILEYIFKDIANPSMYCGGSNDNSAPSLMALLATMYKLANDFNGVIDDVNGIIDISILRIPTEWDEDLENGDKFTSEARRIPTTPENRGAVNKKDQMVNSTAINMQAVEEKLAETQPVPREMEQPAPQPQTAPVAPVIPQQALVPPMAPPVMQPPVAPPYQPPAPQQSNKEDGISVNDLLGFQPQPMQPVYQQMPHQMVQQPMMYPGQPVMYPQQQWGYPQPQLPQQIGGTPVLW